MALDGLAVVSQWRRWRRRLLAYELCNPKSKATEKNNLKNVLNVKITRDFSLCQVAFLKCVSWDAV